MGLLANSFLFLLRRVSFSLESASDCIECQMSARTELQIAYDKVGNPISAECTRCGKVIPVPGSTMRAPADVIVWLTEQFLRHKRINHPPEDNEYGWRRDVSRWTASLASGRLSGPKK
jgi:hypothetical protein